MSASSSSAGRRRREPSETRKRFPAIAPDAPDASKRARKEHVRIGCAGWAISRDEDGVFPRGPSHLARYASVFDAVEINSSFYRPHRRSTYERWAASVPAAFRFSVKMPRDITHDACLDDARALDAFLDQAEGLGAKLGTILVQLAPSLAFDVRAARRFFRCLRDRWTGPVVCEPRHASWFTARADALLCDSSVARVAADPARVPAAAAPAGCADFVYYRLHGSPRMYYSAYAHETLDRLAGTLLSAVRTAPTWCIFDNTAAGAAVHDAAYMLSRLDARGR